MQRLQQKGGPTRLQLLSLYIDVLQITSTTRRPLVQSGLHQLGSQEAQNRESIIRSLEDLENLTRFIKVLFDYHLSFQCLIICDLVKVTGCQTDNTYRVKITQIIQDAHESSFKWSQKQFIWVLISHTNTNNIMKRGPLLTAEKVSQQRIQRKSNQKIKFNLEPCNLACFKRNENPAKSKGKVEVNKQPKSNSQHKLELKSVEVHRKQQNAPTLHSKFKFDEKVVFMEYGNIEVYIDNSKTKKSNEAKSKQSSKKSDKKHRSEPSQELDDEIVTSCVRVITEETDYTSNALKTPPNLTPRSNYYHFEHYQDSFERAYTTRDKRSGTVDENKNFIIDFSSIQQDGRTTVMVKNIPNKYNQETLLEEFSVNYENKFDFFYLPIDKDHDCNVGYAFVNFTHPHYLKQFYVQFHNKKWKKYKSPKICNISYARYQGTLELANHFRHSKILQHKDRKLKPLIGIQEANRIRDIEEMVRMQRERQ